MKSAKKIRLPSVFRYLKGILPADWWRYCRGVYPTFEEACAAIPSGKRVGFDHSDIAKVFLVERMKPSDYAALYWLGRILPESRTILDFGGNLGASYYLFQKYLSYPKDLRWLVCEVSAVAQAGREFAAGREAPHLEFTADISHGDGFDVLYTAGTLQFLSGDLAELIAKLNNKPTHLLINRIPLTDGMTFFTVQDSEFTCVAYRISNRVDFISSLENLGYRLIDSWRCAESWCTVRFRKSRTVREYSGLYFRLND